jgi:hypothetical protein
MMILQATGLQLTLGFRLKPGPGFGSDIELGSASDMAASLAAATSPDASPSGSALMSPMNGAGADAGQASTPGT